MQRCVSTLGRVLTRRFISSREIKNSFQNKNTCVRYLVQVNIRESKPTVPSGRYAGRAFTIQDLLQYINNGKLFYLKQLTNIFHTTDFSILNSEEVILLLECCSSVPDSSRGQRHKVCHDIFTHLQNSDNLNIDIYNAYLRACSKNNFYVHYQSFLSTLKCDPTKDTYKLLLENVCNHGYINNALSILELMKLKGISVDADILNNLILAHAIEGGFDLAETVFNTMRTAQIVEDSNTRLALLTGLIRRNNFKEFKQAVEKYPMKLTEDELLRIIEELGLKGNESWLSIIHNFYKDISVTREFQNKVEQTCIHLIHMGCPDSALNIYKEFVMPIPEVTYSYNLLKEMLHCNFDINKIISIAKDLEKIYENGNILEKLTEVALKVKYVEQSWTLLHSLSILRPHYIWPLLAHNGKTKGENGIFSALKNAKELKIKPDEETLENYVFPYCDLTNLKLVVLKLQEYGLTVREIVSPLIIVLLKQKRLRQAMNLCNLYNVSITGDKILELLSKSWGHTKDTTSILTLLRRYCESNTVEHDVVGRFLIDCSGLCKNYNDFKEFLLLINKTGESRLKITTRSGNILQEITKNCSDEKLQNELKTSINSILDFNLKLSDDVPLIHPRNMDLDGLECHLIELQQKNMETRGVLRKLIQMHASRGNLERVTELREIFLDSGYLETAGIKSSIMHSYVLGGYLDEAMSLYTELKNLNPEFNLDTFKFLDLARLLILNKRFEEGYSILQNETLNSKTYGNTKSILRNCRDLLTSCSTGEEVEKVFSVLLKSGLCKPTNIVLGPLVKVHLKRGDVNKAVDKYIELSQKYQCTPLQLEILCVVAKQENSELLQKVITATEAVHGRGPTQIGLISALAENGQEKALRKTLTMTVFSIKPLLQKRCSRWVEEGKLEPLKCLLNACDRLPEEFVDIHFIYKCIFDLFGINGDYAGAATFYNSILEDSAIKFHLKNKLETIQSKQYINYGEDVKMKNKI